MTDAQLTERRKWIALALLASTQFVIVLDAARPRPGPSPEKRRSVLLIAFFRSLPNRRER